MDSSYLASLAKKGDIFRLQEILHEEVPQNYLSTAFLSAASAGHIEAAQLLLDKRADINAVNRRGQTALSLVAQNEYHLLEKSTQEKMVTFLLGHGASTTICDDSGMTILMHACSSDNISVVSQLIQAGVDVCQVNVAENQRTTALLQACQRGNARMVKLLLQHNASVTINYKNSEDFDALHAAIRKRNTELVSLLLEYKANTAVTYTHLRRTPLHYAVIMGNVGILQCLLPYYRPQTHTSVNTGSYTSTSSFISTSTFASTSASASTGINRDNSHRTPLLLQQPRQHSHQPQHQDPYVPPTLGTPADTHSHTQHNTTSHLTSDSPPPKSQKILKNLENHFPERNIPAIDLLDAHNKSALMMACAQGNGNMVKLLLSAKCNVNAPFVHCAGMSYNQYNEFVCDIERGDIHGGADATCCGGACGTDQEKDMHDAGSVDNKGPGQEGEHSRRCEAQEKRYVAKELRQIVQRAATPTTLSEPTNTGTLPCYNNTSALPWYVVHNRRHVGQWTALTYACVAGHAEIVKMLVRGDGAKPTLRGVDAQSILEGLLHVGSAERLTQEGEEGQLARRDAEEHGRAYVCECIYYGKDRDTGVNAGGSSGAGCSGAGCSGGCWCVFDGYANIHLKYNRDNVSYYAKGWREPLRKIEELDEIFPVNVFPAHISQDDTRNRKKHLEIGKNIVRHVIPTDGYTVLMFATQYQHLPIVKTLIQLKECTFRDIIAYNRDHKCIFYLAGEAQHHKNREILSFLIEYYWILWKQYSKEYKYHKKEWDRLLGKPLSTFGKMEKSENRRETGDSECPKNPVCLCDTVLWRLIEAHQQLMVWKERASSSSHSGGGNGPRAADNDGYVNDGNADSGGGVTSLLCGRMQQYWPFHSNTPRRHANLSASTCVAASRASLVDSPHAPVDPGCNHAEMSLHGPAAEGVCSGVMPPHVVGASDGKESMKKQVRERKEEQAVEWGTCAERAEWKQEIGEQEEVDKRRARGEKKEKRAGNDVTTALLTDGDGMLVHTHIDTSTHTYGLSSANAFMQPPIPSRQPLSSSPSSPSPSTSPASSASCSSSSSSSQAKPHITCTDNPENENTGISHFLTVFPEPYWLIYHARPEHVDEEEEDKQDSMHVASFLPNTQQGNPDFGRDVSNRPEGPNSTRNLSEIHDNNQRIVNFSDLDDILAEITQDIPEESGVNLASGLQHEIPRIVPRNSIPNEITPNPVSLSLVLPFPTSSVPAISTSTSTSSSSSSSRLPDADVSNIPPLHRTFSTSVSPNTLHLHIPHTLSAIPTPPAPTAPMQPPPLQPPWLRPSREHSSLVESPRVQYERGAVEDVMADGSLDVLISPNTPTPIPTNAHAHTQIRVEVRATPPHVDVPPRARSTEVETGTPAVPTATAEAPRSRADILTTEVHGGAGNMAGAHVQSSGAGMQSSDMGVRIGMGSISDAGGSGVADAAVRLGRGRLGERREGEHQERTTVEHRESNREERQVRPMEEDQDGAEVEAGQQQQQHQEAAEREMRRVERIEVERQRQESGFGNNGFLFGLGFGINDTIPRALNNVNFPMDPAPEQENGNLFGNLGNPGPGIPDLVINMNSFYDGLCGYRSPRLSRHTINTNSTANIDATSTMNTDTTANDNNNNSAISAYTTNITANTITGTTTATAPSFSVPALPWGNGVGADATYRDWYVYQGTLLVNAGRTHVQRVPLFHLDLQSPQAHAHARAHAHASLSSAQSTATRPHSIRSHAQPPVPLPTQPTRSFTKSAPSHAQSMYRYLQEHHPSAHLFRRTLTATALELKYDVMWRTLLEFWKKFNRKFAEIRENVKFLEFSHDSVRKYGKTALVCDDLCFFYDMNAEFTSDGRPFSMLALDLSRKNYFSEIIEFSEKYQIPKGFNANLRDKNIRKTLLMSAISHNNPEYVTFLLGKHADVTSTDRNGHTALMYAVNSRHDDRTVANYLRLLLSPRVWRDNTHTSTGTGIGHVAGAAGTGTSTSAGIAVLGSAATSQPRSLSRDRGSSLSGTGAGARMGVGMGVGMGVEGEEAGVEDGSAVVGDSGQYRHTRAGVRKERRRCVIM